MAGGLAGCMTEKQGKANLEAEAKVSKADAEKTALAQVPGGKIKEGELEKEKGKLIWSFDIATPGTKDVTEVQVDAITGGVVSKVVESAAEQAKEKKAGEKERKGKGDEWKREERRGKVRGEKRKARGAEVSSLALSPLIFVSCD